MLKDEDQIIYKQVYSCVGNLDANEGKQETEFTCNMIQTNFNK